MMTPTLAVLLTSALTAGTALPNLDFAQGKPAHWEGAGFILSPAGSGWQASSADQNGKGRTAILHRTFVLPRSASTIGFRAALVRPAGVGSGGMLDVVLEAAAREVIPKQVRTADGWTDAGGLRRHPGGELPECRWDVTQHAGRRVRIALVDQDDRPGCHVLCTGFTLITRDDGNARQFRLDMHKIVAANNLPAMSLASSKHFLALSNADAGFTEYRLHNCETIYPLFFEHFRRRGFPVREPAEKMMVAIFDTQAGFEAYTGAKLSSAVTGLYHTPTNRLVVYDFATNRGFAHTRQRAYAEAKRATTDLERERRLVTLGRWARDRRDDANISTIMHEVAHQLSFNGGLLNRFGDAPAWLIEGLAVYCESTVNGAWQGIGEPNPQRAAVLAGTLRDGGPFFTLRQLAHDDWLRKSSSVERIVLGYSQSWALFRLLMEERRGPLRSYLALIHDRRTPEHRLADLAEAFGDLGKLEKRYQAYLRDLARREAR